MFIVCIAPPEIKRPPVIMPEAEYTTFPLSEQALCAYKAPSAQRLVDFRPSCAVARQRQAGSSAGVRDDVKGVLHGGRRRSGVAASRVASHAETAISRRSCGWRVSASFVNGDDYTRCGRASRAPISVSRARGASRRAASCATGRSAGRTGAARRRRRRRRRTACGYHRRRYHQHDGQCVP